MSFMVQLMFLGCRLSLPARPPRAWQVAKLSRGLGLQGAHLFLNQPADAMSGQIHSPWVDLENSCDFYHCPLLSFKNLLLFFASHSRFLSKEQSSENLLEQAREIWSSGPVEGVL